MVMKVVHLKMAVHADDTAGDESGSSVLNKKKLMAAEMVMSNDFFGQLKKRL